MEFIKGKSGLFQVYQPIVTMENNEIAHYETLLRFNSNANIDFSNIQDFIGHLELSNQIMDLDKWNIQQLASKLNNNSLGEGKPCALNLSSKTIESKGFLDHLENIYKELNDPKRLAFEITETVAVSDYEKISKFIDFVKAKGGTVGIDDYGSGFASPEYLKMIPADAVKIDGDFVDDLVNNPMNARFIEKVVDSAQTTGMSVIAERVEKIEQRDALVQLGVKKGQGYLFGKPEVIPATQFEIHQTMDAIEQNRDSAFNI